MTEKYIGSTGHDCECCGHIWISHDRRLCAECEAYTTQLEAVSAKLAEAVGALLPLLEDAERYSEVIAAGDALSEYQKLQTKG